MWDRIAMDLIVCKKVLEGYLFIPSFIMAM